MALCYTSRVEYGRVNAVHSGARTRLCTHACKQHWSWRAMLSEDYPARRPAPDIYPDHSLPLPLLLLPLPEEPPLLEEDPPLELELSPLSLDEPAPLFDGDAPARRLLEGGDALPWRLRGGDPPTPTAGLRRGLRLRLRRRRGGEADGERRRLTGTGLRVRRRGGERRRSRSSSRSRRPAPRSSRTLRSPLLPRASPWLLYSALDPLL